ncbi:MAG: transcription termination factor Rho [Lachnospiraceae bacterium]|nr:transcription termination factor Rho [Lachnospiraceae bacterium]
MRAKLESLPMSQLRDIAKQQGIKYIMKLRKSDLINEILKATGYESEVSGEVLESGNENLNRLPEHEDNKISDSNDKEEEKIQEKAAQNTEKVTKEKVHVYHTFEKDCVNRAKPPMAKNASGSGDQEENLVAEGILEVMPEGYGFIRCENFLPGENDVYVSPSQIRRFRLKTGDILNGQMRLKNTNEKFGAMTHLNMVNNIEIEDSMKRPNFEDLTPIFPNQRLKMETISENMAMRIVDLVSPIGKGQRGMIVSPPKAGKTTLLKEVAKSIQKNNPDMHMIILLIDERPEEVTDIKEAITGSNVEVIYSTFDELPEHHKRVSEMVIERAKRLVELKKDVIILLDSITRLARAYNMTIPPSGRTLSGGLDPAALHMPKRFFGAARNMREGGSLTVLATALVDTGSKMDDVVYEEFKGTGNMELVLNRKLSEKRVFPAIDIVKSGTRREDLLLDTEENEAAYLIRKTTNEMRPEDAVEKIMDLFSKTRNNKEFVQMIKKYLH